MHKFKIYSKRNNAILFSGNFADIKTCLECAVSQNIDLSYADLRQYNLSNANIDDAQLNGADFSYSNLSGANISESKLQGCIFYHTSLYNTCLAYSNLKNSDFRFAGIGATNITGADISRAYFSTCDCSKINFMSVEEMRDCYFEGTNGSLYKSSKPPIAISGVISRPIIAIQDIILINNRAVKIAKSQKPELIKLLAKLPERQLHTKV